MHSQTLGSELSVPKYAFLIFDAKVLVETAPTPPLPFAQTPCHHGIASRLCLTVAIHLPCPSILNILV